VFPTRRDRRLRLVEAALERRQARILHVALDSPLLALLSPRLLRGREQSRGLRRLRARRLRDGRSGHRAVSLRVCDAARARREELHGFLLAVRVGRLRLRGLDGGSGVPKARGVLRVQRATGLVARARSLERVRRVELVGGRERRAEPGQLSLEIVNVRVALAQQTQVEAEILPQGLERVAALPLSRDVPAGSRAVRLGRLGVPHQASSAGRVRVASLFFAFRKAWQAYM
jgi:hypothetical protein